MTSLLKTNPELSKEWHPTRNGSLTPADLTCAQTRRSGGSASKATNGKLVSTIEIAEALDVLIALGVESVLITA